MPNTWYPDTCYCVIDLTNNKFIKKCKHHKNSGNVNIVLSHNQNFNLKYGHIDLGPSINKSKHDEILSDKVDEKVRIRNL